MFEPLKNLEKDFVRSRNLLARAEKVLVGGVNSPVRSFGAVGHLPFFVQSGKGSKIVSADHREYIDFIGAWGPNILGHKDPWVSEAISQALLLGFSYGATHENEIKLAEKVSAALPAMELMRFVSSGTEATMSAIRVARGYTKRDLILKFEGCYHGHSDGLLIKAGSGGLTFSVPDSLGVPQSYVQNTITAPYNDISAVQETFRTYGEKIAAVIVEPVAGNMGWVPPVPNFLKDLQKVAHDHGALVIFDEVITGFRLCYGGAQTIYQMSPDLTCLGKILGGGLPIGAYGGRRDIMELVAPLGPVYQAGTQAGNPLSMAAGIATLDRLKELNPYASLKAKQEVLTQAIQHIIEKHELPCRVNAMESAFTLFHCRESVVDLESVQRAQLDKFKEFYWHLLSEGLLFPPSQFETSFVSVAHSDDDMQKTIKAFSLAFDRVYLK
jgi:glutamate-1-semialdehyde 2,1-aminomutase